MNDSARLTDPSSRAVRVQFWLGALTAVIIALAIAIPFTLGPVIAGVLAAVLAAPWIIYCAFQLQRAIRAERSKPTT